jgi:hypothetical protein
VIDKTSFAKKGDDTCGIQAQWCGKTGKIGNCVVTVHLGCATDDFHALVDCDLFLPKKTWGADPELREKAGVPGDVTYRPKWRIAVDPFSSGPWPTACALEPISVGGRGPARSRVVRTAKRTRPAGREVA